MRSLPLLSILAALTLAATTAPVAADETSRLHDLFHRAWEEGLKENPLTATYVGRHEYDDRLPEATVEALERQTKGAQEYLDELGRIDRSQLSAEDQVSADIFRVQLEDAIADYRLGAWQMPFNADSGFHSDFPQLADQMPFDSVKGYENYIARLRAWPRYMNQQIELMRIGIKRGMTMPRAVLNGFENTITAHIVSDPTKSVFWKPFERFPASMPETERERLRAEARKAVMEGVVPGYKTFLDFYQKEYLPNARKTIAASDLPDGPAFYAQQVKHYTTLDISPDEIHRIGLAEVERIDKEMKEVIRQTGFKGDFAAFLQFLRTDPRFYAKTPEDLLKEASYIAKQIDGKLPSLFGKLPRTPYTVQPVPEHIAPKYTSGRYVEAPVGSTQPGIYWVNTYKLENRPLYNLEALTLHEAVPGHHLQISLNKELSDLPEIRRYSYLSAFGEGWGLYSEWLGLEAGFYKDPYSNFGRLTYEMWRACRLVVDTGMHSKGWTRQQAIDYLASHTALPLHEVETEIDRYISWPGQALAYKMGELKIKELRKRAETALGQGFDVRAFHDVVLGSGSVPLTVLESNVDRWIAEQTKVGAR
ncbi:MAG TPA: DUF885 domain-containing protein [Thermoanaerobaculia bacterium]|jgi:uncharacterized protein (DUF885 family)|nr:DUF885 domain-containing protein [Thermoanaerobaculia bacterium]